MRWPCRRARPAPTEPARQARQAAEAKLQATRDRDQEVRQMSNRLRELRRRNRFAEAIYESMRPR